MFPVVFRVGAFEITSFGVLVAIGALAALWVLRRELVARSLPAAAAEAGVTAIVGGIIGAKLLWMIEHVGEEPFLTLLLSRGGMSWFGGLAGGLVAGLWSVQRGGWPLWPLLAAAAPALAVGQTFGRLGCFLVGDDYGRPSDLPWAVAFPKGLPPTVLPVHPTQIYEALALPALAAALILWRRRGMPDREIVAHYLLIAGAVRFAIEFIRVNERVALGLTLAHWASLVMIVGGLIIRFRPSASTR